MTDQDFVRIERRTRQRMLSEHDDLLRRVRTAANTVADNRAAESAAPEPSPRKALARELAHRGLMAAFPDVLLDVADATDLEPQAPPVPAPPYVTVSGTAVVLRLPVSGFRLVISIRTFTVDRRPREYHVVSADPVECLTVSARSHA